MDPDTQELSSDKGAQWAMDTRACDAFVSYASSDASVANLLVEILEGNAISCWIAPRDVMPGAHYADEIIRGITGCKVLVLILSSSAIGSKHVGKEPSRRKIFRAAA